MAYSNGQIYVDTSVTPNIGVSIKDLQQCFGVVAGGDLGNIIKNISELNEDGYIIINKWARYKPQRASIFTNITHGTLFDESNTRKGGRFGLNIPFCQNSMMNQLVHSIISDPTGTDASESWGYLYPRGEAVTSGTNQHGKEYYRLTDFVRNPNDAGDTTPAALKGYNHNANLPFVVEMNMLGVAEVYDTNERRWYYEVNNQVAKKLTFTFKNSTGNDIHLQDLVDIEKSYSGNIAWRPVIQAFCEYKTANGNNQYDNQDWWRRGNLGSRDIEVSGDEITTMQGASFTVSLELTEAPFNDNTNQYWHVCVGVGCCKPLTETNPWYSGNNLYIVPYDLRQIDNNVFPFHYLIRVISEIRNNLYVTSVGWISGGSASWTTVSGNNTFEVGVNAMDELHLTMTFIKKEQGQKLDFIKYGNIAQSGYTAMIVRAKVTYNGDEIGSIWLEPADHESNWSDTHEKIEANEEEKTLYAKITSLTNSMPAGSYYTYHLEATTNDGESYGNIGSFTIYKRTTV